MSHDIAKRSFLAVLAFLAFIVPLILADEVSLLTNWLFIFISWLLIILLSALLSPTKEKTTDPLANLASKE
jgi:uncharacterized membrane protein YhaH (DUF805 family)